MKKYYVIGIGVVVAASALTLIPVQSSKQELVTRQVGAVKQIEIKTGPRLLIGTTTIMVDVATTSAAVKHGLSGRLSLPADHGMLFLFPSALIYSFWMPDMHFDLDIIWINNGKVVDITENASAKFDPANPVFYRPKSPARNVVETNAGFTETHGIKVGDKVLYLDIPDL